MAIYYVRTDGNDANTGLGSSTAQAWLTITKAIGSTGIAPGDTLYIAPGVYRGVFTAAFTNPANSGQRLTIAGNPTASQFSGVNPGPVILTNYSSNTTNASGTTLVIGKDFVTVQDVCIYGKTATGSPFYGASLQITSSGFVLTRCFVGTPTSSNDLYHAGFTITAGGIGPVISQCIFYGGTCELFAATHSGAWNNGATVTDSIFWNMSGGNTNFALRLSSQSSGQFGGAKVVNCYLSAQTGVSLNSQISTTYPSLIQNCVIEAITGIAALTSNGQITQSYNVINAQTSLTNVASSVTTVTNAFNPLNAGMGKIQGFGDYPFISPLSIMQSAINAGINTNSPASDMFGTTWLAPSTPTIGPSEFQSYTPSSVYLPTERNASAITIAPGSTSQSIEFYLGVTGLTFATSGLAAYYVRNQSAPVAITLVTQTPTGAWTSGGFAEISSSLVPGVYRLDVPNAAFAAGASDVTIVVRGAAGTNGAVLTVTLSSGGLTAAQTAAAVWDATASAYNTAGSMGEAGQKLTGYSLASSQTFSTTGAVGSVTGAVTVGTNNDKTGYALSTAANTTAADAVWNSTRSGHTTAGTFGQYVNAELVTPVTQSALVRMGPFQVIADGVATPMPLDIQKGAQHGVDIQCVDNNLSAIDITSATITAKVYNSGGTLVDTYSCTATYAADGRATFIIDTTVTDVPGTYTATITRTTGASDTQIFGPLRIYVRDI